MTDGLNMLDEQRQRRARSIPAPRNPPRSKPVGIVDLAARPQPESAAGEPPAAEPEPEVRLGEGAVGRGPCPRAHDGQDVDLP